MKYFFNSILSLFGLLKPEKIGKKFQTWYGRVNTWQSAGWSLLKKDIVRCAKEGVTGYIVEMAGWARADAWSKAWLDAVDRDYKQALKLCRKKGLWLFVSIVNDNMGLGKYGDKGKPLSALTGEAHVLCDIIKRHGHKNVIVQPVAETRTQAGRNFEQHCVRELGEKFQLVYNDGSRPSGVPSGFKFRAWHQFNVTDPVPADALSISDTGQIITQLGEGLNGPGKPQMLKSWAKAIKNMGCPVAGYYAFKYAGHDKPAIKALGKRGK